MDGRDCGPPRSVHIPPPLLTGLAMESHRLGAAAAAGRIPPSPGHLGAGHSASLHTGKYLSSAINLRSHHGDAFPVGSSPFLGGYVSSSNPHGGPAPMTSDPSFRAPNPTNLQMAQLWASHLHEGFSHLSGSLYPGSYIPLGPLEHPSSGSPLHAQLGQHPLFEPPKEGFYLPGHGGPPALHSQSGLSGTHTPSSLSREREALHYHRVARDGSRDRERPCKAEPGEPHPRGPRDGDGPKEEPRSHSVVDLTEDDRRTGVPHRPSKKASPFFREPSPGPGGGELKPGAPLQTSSLSNCRGGTGAPSSGPPGPDQDRWHRDLNHDDENTRPGVLSHGDRAKRCDPAATSLIGTLHASRGSPSPHGNPAHLPNRLMSAGTYPPPPLPPHLPPSLYPLYPIVKDPGREHRVIAPTFVPSVEVYEERLGPIQIASQARESKSSRRTGERDPNRQPGGERTQADSARPPPAHETPPHHGRSTEMLREEGSVIRSNCFSTRRPAPSEAHAHRRGRSPDADSAPTGGSSREPSRTALEAEYRGHDRDRIQRASAREGGARHRGAADSTWMHPDQPSPKGFVSPEHKWKPFDMADYASGQMSALAAQHGQGPRGEDDGKSAYLDPSGVHRPAPSGSSRGSPQRLHPEPHREVSAMQSLIKYSGSFAKGPGSRPGSDGKGPFGGLGSMKPEPKTQHFPSQHPGKQLKRDPERPESAKSFGRETVGSQGEVEVRHPPVGIAVAVARQRDSGSKGLVDRERPLMGGIKGSGRPEEDGRDEGVRDDRLLQGRLEREQEKLLRESKELAEYTRMHLPEGTAHGLNPNPMVTGRPPLAGSGRWPPDPASHLVSHPWMPRPSGPSMWLSGSPYGLGPPSLHQGLPPGYPPTLPGSMPPQYQLARDPQTGQLVVISTEHLPHYAAELMERSPPLWPGLYPGAGASLQHAQELHLLSQQQLLRQQELLMIQQQAAQVMELQRSVHLAERLKASEQRAEMEDKAAKRGGDGGCGKQGVSTRPGPALHSRKLAARSPTPSPSPSYSKALTPLPSPVYSKALTPLPSPVAAALKSEGGPKAEKSLPGRSYSHPSTPAPRPPSPASSPPLPPPPVPPKEECAEACEGKELELQNHVSAPAQALYPEIPPGYPYQPLPAPFGSHYPYLLQPAAAADADGLAPDVPLPAETLERSAPPADVKPRRLRSPAAAEPPPPPPATPAPPRREERATPGNPAVKEEPGLEEGGEEPELRAARRGETAAAPGASEAEAGRRTVVTSLSAEGGAEPDGALAGGRVKLEETTVISGPGPYRAPATGPLAPEAEPPVREGSASPASLAYRPPAHYGEPQAWDGPPRSVGPASPRLEEMDPGRCPERPGDEVTEIARETPSPPPPVLPPPLRPRLSVEDVAPDDPMAGLIALVAASELPQARPLPALVGAGPPLDHAPLELAGLEGMTLLGEMAELELERQCLAVQCVAASCGLDVLLQASRQVLLEELHRPALAVRLPRELDPNRKYSWMQKKEEPLFSKSALEGMDILEVDYRMRLAELQRRYKDRQRELMKLQRRREREEKRLLEESSRASARRGPGRPPKRRHSLAAPSPPTGKPLDPKSARFSKSLTLSEDSEAGEVLRKRFRGPGREEDEEMDAAARAKRKSRQWADREPASSFPQEMQMKSGKKRRLSEQEQLASKLDRALSLTKLGKLHRAPFPFAGDPCGRAAPGPGGCGKLSALRETELKAEAGKRSLSAGLGLFQKSSKGGKNKMAAKTKNAEPCLNAKGQQKALYSPVRSDVSSYSNNTDSEEEEEEEFMAGWPPYPALSRTGARPRRPGLCGKASNQSWPPSKRGEASGSLRPRQALSRTTRERFGLLLREAGASSSEDSFDQGY